jgi:hypothetical protein
MKFEINSDNGMPFFWQIFCSIYLLAALYYSYNGLFGSWTVSVLGVPYYYNWDPDGFYLGAGLTFFDERYVGFVGHPGIPLMLLIQFIARCAYGLAFLFNHQLVFEQFVAKNIFWIIFYVKVSIAACYLAAFAMFYAVSRFFLTKTFSQLAVLAFATTCINLYYFNKISPEPLLILFVFASFFTCLKFIQTQSRRVSYLFIIISAVTAALAALTKIMIAAALPVFVVSYICFFTKLKFTRRIIGGAVFILVFALTFFLLGRKVDWGYFISFWLQYTPASGVSSGFGNNGFQNIVVNLNKWIRILLELFSFKIWEPSLSTQRGQFNVATLPFLFCSLIGYILYLFNNWQRRSALVALFVFFVMLLPSVLYRAAYNYYVMHLAVASIFVSYFVEVLLKKIGLMLQLRFFLAAVLIIGLNLFSFVIFFQAKSSDLYGYNKYWKEYFFALNRTAYGERIGLVSVGDKTEYPGRIISYYVAQGSSLHKYFNDFFEYFDRTPGSDISSMNKIAVLLNHGPQGIKRVNILR